MTHKEIVTNLRGIFPPAVTPFNRKGEVDIGCFRENVQRYVGIGLSGVVVAGSTGEAPFLTERERLQLVEAARAILRPPELLIASTGLESTLLTLRLSREAIARGADVVLVITPNYYKARMDSPTLQGHFRAVADGIRRPVVMYNIPQFTGIRMAPETIAALSRHPNIAGLKESSGDLEYVRRILKAVRRGFRVLVGSPVIFFEALRAGAAGGVLGQAGYAPHICVGIFDAVQQGRLKLGRDLQQRLTFLAQNTALLYGVPGVKAAMDVCGYHGGPPRAPFMPLGPAQRRRVAAAVHEATRGLDV